MKHCQTRVFCSRIKARRSGFILVVVVVVIAVSLALFGIWAKAVVGQHQQLRNKQLRMQTVRLAEAGVQRGMTRHAADSQYTEETWTVPANVLDGRHAAEVQIRIASETDGPALSIEARGRYPAEGPRRAQVTKRVEIANQLSGIEP